MHRRSFLSRFLVEGLCLLMVFQGYPALAIEEADLQPRVWESEDTSTSIETTVSDGTPWIEFGRGLSKVQGAWDSAGQPWGDALGILLAMGAMEDGSPTGRPDEVGLPDGPHGLNPGSSPFRPTAEELVSLTAGFEGRGVGAKATLERIPLIPGWNLLSIPEEPADASPASVLAPIGGSFTRAYAYDACDTADPWKVYDPNDPTSSDWTVLDHTQGFWLEATHAVDLPSDGTLPATTTFDLCVGWNLIGFPAGQSRHVRHALQSIEGKYLRVFGYDAADPGDPWEVYSVDVPDWANDLALMHPGRGYWVLVTEATTLEIANQDAAPEVSIDAPADLAVITAPTELFGTVSSKILDHWTLSYRALSYRATGEGDWIELASEAFPVSSAPPSAPLATFDPTLLLNGMYEIRLEAIDLAGMAVDETIAVSVEGDMKIGHFTLSYVDLAVPLSGLDIEIHRTYDSRDQTVGDFGVGWRLGILQGSYTNNRPPGDGWQITQPGGPLSLPCTQVSETKSHLTTIRLSEREIYRFRLVLEDPATVIGGCFARAEFRYLDGPLPGSTLEILGNDQVIYRNAGDTVIDSDSLNVFEPGAVRLTTRDGRQFDLDLETGVTGLQDRQGNRLDITSDGIRHSSGEGIDFVRDALGRIEQLRDPQGATIDYAYDGQGDLATVTDRANATTRYTYDSHRLVEVQDPLGNRAVRNEYDAEGRLVSTTDASGRVVEFQHDIDARREVHVDRLGQARIFEYDDRGGIVREIDEAGAETTRTFDGRGRLTSETDPLGQTTTRAYDGAGNLIRVTDPLGQSFAYTYNNQSLPLTFTDARGKVTTHVYDGSGNIVSQTGPDGQTTQFGYDSAGNLTSVTDAAGGVSTREYDGRGNLVREVDPTGVATVWTYDALGEVLTESRMRTTPAGVDTVTVGFTYDDAGRLVETTDPYGATTRTVWNANGQVVERHNKRGGVTRYAYDVQGRLLSTTWPDGGRESQAYDANGRLVSRTDRAGRITRFTHDAVGRVLSTTFPDGTSIASTYDAAGRQITSRNAVGQVTSYAYDTAGRMTARTDALGQTTEFTYDANGHRTSITGPRGFATRFEYDDAGRLKRRIYPDGTEDVSTYDALGRRVSVQDQAGIETAFAYDALGRLIQVTDALGQETHYAYDAFGNRVSQRDAAGLETRFEYDRLGRLVRRILPTDEAETMAYDASGNPTSHTDFRGRTTTFQFDAAHRLVGKTFSDGQNVAIAYNAQGLRQSVTDASGVTTYAYDDRDRLTVLTQPSGHRLEYAYDLQGRRTGLTAVVGTTRLETTYGYDALDRLTTVTDPLGQTTVHSYDANGNRASLVHPNGTVTQYTYDTLDRLIGLETRDAGQGVVQGYDYTLGAAGHRLRIDEVGGISRAYTYDDLYRLTDETVGESGAVVSQNTYQWSPTGNRLGRTTTDDSGTVTVPSTFDTRDRLLTEGSATYTWDANGNLLGASDRAMVNLVWDDENRLTALTLADGALLEHTYDVDGLRTGERLTPADGGTPTTTEFLVDPIALDGFSQVIAEVSDAGAVEAYYVRGVDLLGIVRGNELRTVHSDGLGSIRRLTDASGAVTDRYTYSAFGELEEHEGSDPNRFLFAGESRDRHTGLYHLRARWMDPGTGRFVSSDPFPGQGFDPESLHKYSYAHNDPINHTDPSGLFLGGNFASVMAALSIASFIVNSGLALFNILRSFTVSSPEEAARLRFAAAMNTLGAFLAFFGGGLGGLGGGGLAVAGAGVGSGTLTVIGQAVVVRADVVIGSVLIPASTYYLASSSNGSDGGGDSGGSGGSGGNSGSGGGGSGGRIDVKDPHVNVPKHNLNRLAPDWARQRQMLVDAVRQLSNQVPKATNPNGSVFEATVQIQSTSGKVWATTIRWFEYANGSKVINTAFIP